MKKNIFFSITLLFTGILMLLRNIGIIKSNISFFIVGLGLMAAYILMGHSTKHKNILILIPSLTLISLALLEFTLNNYNVYNIDYSLFLYVLGLCCVLVYIIHIRKQNFKSFKKRYWIIYLAILLIILSTIYKFKFTNIYLMLKYIWPFILLSIGVFILIGDYKEKISKSSDS